MLLTENIRPTEKMRLTALWNDANADSQAFPFNTLLFEPMEGRVLYDEEGPVVLPCSVALDSGVQSIYPLIFRGIARNYTVDSCITNRAILLNKNAEL